MIPNGPSLDATSSAPTDGTVRRWSLASGALLSVALGLAIVLADSLFRLPLHLPGWRGLVMVPLLMAANRVSGQAWGATLAGGSAAAFCIALGDPVRFDPLAYFLPALFADGVLMLPFGLLVACAAGAAANLGRLMTALGAGAMPGHHLGPMAWISHAGFGAFAGLLVWMFWRFRR